MRPFFVAVDFDGTISDHRYPDVGPEVPGAFRWLRTWQAAGAKLILWTMRGGDSEKEGPVLSEAVRFCRQGGVEFHSVNCNPGQESWSGSPKVYAHAYVDDTAIGCPLRPSPRMGGRPCVDWEAVGPAVLAMIKSHGEGAHHGP
jgi:hypothetical protein